jgi:hypothetical protein
LIRNYEDLESNIRNTFADEFCDYFDAENEIEPPPMIFAHANLTSGNENAQAYEIQVVRKNVSAAKYLLEAIYEITPEVQTAHKCVPYSIKHESQDIYRSVLRTQNNYLAEHRNIPLAGSTVRQMHEIVMWDQIEQPPHEVLFALKGLPVWIRLLRHTISANLICHVLQIRMSILLNGLTPSSLPCSLTPHKIQPSMILPFLFPSE